MKIKGLTPRQFLDVLDAVNKAEETTICPNYYPVVRGRYFTVSLRLASSKDKYHRRSADLGCQGSTRRMVSLCWHGFRIVLARLFDAYPDAVVQTALARYKGREGFARTYQRTYWGRDTQRGAGSLMHPVAYGSLCDCSLEEEGS